MLKYQLIKASSSGKTKWIQSIYFEPDSKSYASYVLLRDSLAKQDEDFLSSFEGRMQRIEFSRNTLTDWKNKIGSLFCVYCNKHDLEIEYDGMLVPQNIKATLEHLNPVSKGGGIFDLSHIVCACGKCNGNRSNKDLKSFLKTKKVSEIEFENRCNIYFNLSK